MKFLSSKPLRWIAALVVLLAIVAAGSAGWIYLKMKGSLPQLDGRVVVAGLGDTVSIERDALGVPTIKGQTRLDVARALGWMHAQDRFFQMDLMRRHAAGELAELFGPKAVPLDKNARIHGFRRTAIEDVALLNTDERALLQAYTAGVNAGLQALNSPPFEYSILRSEPRPWKVEDSVLVMFAMSLQLHEVGTYERSLSVLRLVYGEQATDFFAPLLTTADAALDGSVAETTASIPSSRVIDLRSEPTTADSMEPQGDPASSGSNSFALSGAHTASGVPMLANDMHLILGVPNTWYRASIEWPAAAEPMAGAPANKVTGVTLPGVPFIAAGSNGQITWGFTNAYADTADVVVIEPNVISRTLYKVVDKLVKFEPRHETIQVRGEDPVDFVVIWSRWGPVIGEGDKTRPLAYSWTAHQPGAINLSLIGLETATTVAEALPIAHRAGIPAQNIVVADSQGNIGWSIAGKLPRRVGYDGRFPVSRAYGDRDWDGMQPSEAIPSIVNPASGRLWTANNRIIGGDGLKTLGDGGYEKPMRATRIRDLLAQVEKATPADLLAIQLDDHAPYLNRWHELLLNTLTPEVVAKYRSLATMRKRLADWDGQARIDSASYPLVKYFREQVAQRVFDPIFERCVYKYAGFSWHRFHYEQPLWAILTEKPENLLSTRYDSWNDLLIAAAHGVIDQLDDQGSSVSSVTWGQLNRADIRHPLASLLPNWLNGWLSMPADELPGDLGTPRVQNPDFGASERMVVSPGREAEGIFHMPAGQSGNPLSPYFRAGHEDWVQGNPTPFLPGATQHTLTLQPK